MALYNEIQVGRINRFVQKLLAIKGGPPLPTASSDLSFGINLLNGVENRYLEGWDRYAGSLAGAITANTAGLRLRNPAGSNVIAVIEKASVSASVAGQISFQSGTIGVDLGSAQTPIALDTRGRPLGSCSLSFSITGAAGIGQSMQQSNVGVASNLDFINYDSQQIALLPGSAVQILTPSVTMTLWASFMWRERYLEDSERT
jgi:hypothetical protein